MAIRPVSRAAASRGGKPQLRLATMMMIPPGGAAFGELPSKLALDGDFMS